MRTRLQLISMPFTEPHWTPIQLGVLKAFLDKKFPATELVVENHSAFLSILLDAFGVRYEEVYGRLEFEYFELIYYFLLLRRFNPWNIPGIATKVRNEARRIERLSGGRFQVAWLEPLDRATQKFVQNRIVASLTPGDRNLVGFSLTGYQLYASIYASFLIQEQARVTPPTIVFGGRSLGFSRILRVLQSTGLNALVVLGEGEKKIEHIVRHLQSPTARVTDLHHVNGIVHSDSLTENEIEDFCPSPKDQLASIENLPLPDYDEYFQTVRNHCANQEAFSLFKQRISLILEGSRGCLQQCDFCGYNATWAGLRKKSADMIYQQVTAGLSKYQLAQKVVFTDSSCEPWVSHFCDTLIQNGQTINCGFELQARHNEGFFTRLAAAGCYGIQLGIEALSDPLLIRMKKPTRVIDNLQSMKWVAELGLYNSAGLITHHPRSTTADVQNTIQILKLIPHLQKSHIRFSLSERSPIYEDFVHQNGSRPGPMNRFKMGSELFRHYTDRLAVPPPLRLSSTIEDGWTRIAKLIDQQNGTSSTLTVSRLSPTALLICDDRTSRHREYPLSELSALLYDNCHQHCSLAELEKRTGESPTQIKQILARLCRQGIMVQIQERYLSLALRPREELIIRYFKERP